MKKVLFLLLILATFTSCTESRYKSNVSDETQIRDVIRDKPIKVIDTKFVNGIGDVVIVEINGVQYLLQDGYTIQLTQLP